MSAETQLYTLLSGAAGVTALASDRVYPDLIPENKATPYIGFERTDAQPVTTLEGTVLAWQTNMVIACWADTRLQANALADAALAALAGTAWQYEGSGTELDEATGRLAATLQVSISNPA